MPNLSLASDYELDYADFQDRLLIAARQKAGSWSCLCREIPVSQSHLSLLKNGHNKMGSALMLRVLDYLGLFDELSFLVDQTLGEKAGKRH